MKMCPNPDGKHYHTWIEAEMDPHERAHDPEVEMASDEQPDGDNRKGISMADDKTAPRIRITRQDLLKLAYSLISHGCIFDCRRYLDLDKGKYLNKESHSEECRLQIDSRWEANND